MCVWDLAWCVGGGRSPCGRWSVSVGAGDVGVVWVVGFVSVRWCGWGGWGGPHSGRSQETSLCVIQRKSVEVVI